LIDFGSARQALGAETRALTTLVSPGYAPFEQYFSKGEQQGPWTDIYGLGATLFRAVTGQRPQDTVDRSRAILEAARDTLGDVGEIGQGRYSVRFLKAIDHALQFRPKDRPQTVAEWRREFGLLPDARPNVKTPDSAMMAATIPADEPQSAPIPPAARSVARRAVPEVRAADRGMAPKIIADGPRSESTPPAAPPVVRRTGADVKAADIAALLAQAQADFAALRLTAPPATRCRSTARSSSSRRTTPRPSRACRASPTASSVSPNRPLPGGI